MKGRWPIRKKPKDAQGWNRPMESVRWTRGICFEDADPLALVFGRWRVADEGRRRGSELYKNLDDLVVIFKVVYL